MKTLNKGVGESIHFKSIHFQGSITLIEIGSMWSQIRLAHANAAVNFWQKAGQDFIINSLGGDINVKLKNTRNVKSTRNRQIISFNVLAPADVKIF
jgi:hypothetical protein